MGLGRRFLRYAEQRFHLRAQAEKLRDSRVSPDHSLAAVWLSMFVMFAARLGSLNALEQRMRDKPRQWRGFLGEQWPSADTIGRVAEESIECDQLRQMLMGAVKSLHRRKAIHPLPNGLPFRGASVDAHHLFSTEHRCCSACQVRRVWKGKEENKRLVTEYYHTVVVLQLIGVEPQGVIDIEPVAPGEGEVAAATRLVRRVLANYPQLFDVMVADAQYACAPFFKELRRHGKHVIAVLKDERRELFADIAPMERRTRPEEWEEDNGKYGVQLWDFEDLGTWDAFGEPVRVVHTEEQTRRRTRRGRQWKEETEHHTWYWVTTIPQALANSWTIWRAGHRRWDVESGLNEAVNLWGMDHRFKHEPNAVVAFLLTLFLALLLVRTFYARNLKPAVRHRMSRKLVSEKVAAFLDTADLANCWHPP